MQLPLDTALQRKLKNWSGYFTIAMFAIPLLVLAGWQFDLYFLKTFILPPISMNPLTAVCFIILALSVRLYLQQHTQRIATGLTLLVMLMGILRPVGLLFGFDTGLDTLLYTDQITGGSFSRRMTPVTGTCFFLAGISLLLHNQKQGREQKPAQLIVMAIGLISIFSLLGYLYQVQRFYGFMIHITMAASTALCFLLYCLVLLTAGAGKGYMRELTSTLSGSMIARLLIPSAIVIPSVLGLLRLQGTWAGLYTDEFGTAIYVLSIILIFVVFTWYNAYLLNKRDLLRKQTEDALRDSEQHIQAIFDKAPDAVIVMDHAGLVTKWNAEAEKLFGWKESEARGRLLADLVIPEEFREAHRKGLQRYLDSGKTTIMGRTVDLFALRKDQSAVDVSLRISPFQSGDRQFFVGFVRDITERKQIEDKLKSFNEELSKQVEEKTGELTEIFERISDGFIALDKDFRFSYVNEKAAELGFRDPASLTGKNVWDQFPAAVGSETYHAYHQAMKEQRFISKTDYYPDLDLWLSNFIYPSPNGLSVFIRDITAQKKAEIEINKVKDLADKLVDSLPGVFYFFDANGKFIRWNRELERVTGYTPEEIDAMHPTDFFADGEKAYIAERIEGVFTAGVNDAEANFLTKDGRKIPYYFKAVLINYEGKPCLLGNGIDIAERKKAEEELQESERKYKLLFESNPLPMFMLSLPAYNVVDVNNAALLQYGYDREEFLALSVFHLRPEEDQSKFAAAVDTRFRGIHHAGIWRHIKKNRSIIFVDIVTYDINYMGGQTRLVLANDVTEKHIAEEKLKESYEAIRHLTGYLQNIREEERLHISREIHDELGQLLTVLKMDVSWLNRRMEPGNEIMKEKLGGVLQMIDTTVRTVRRIASELRPSLLDDLGLVAAIEWHLEEFERRSGISKELHVPESEIQIPDAIKIGIFRIFQESLTNVARHSAATKVVVSLTQDENQLNLTIRDNGVGLNEMPGNKRTLGLLGMKERSEMLGGEYRISGSTGEGTTVSVIIPLPETDL